MVFRGRRRPKDGHKPVALDSGYDPTVFSDAAEHELDDSVQIAARFFGPKREYGTRGLDDISKDDGHIAKFASGIFFSTAPLTSAPVWTEAECAS